MTVHLVGAGPGDPALITVRGLELVRSCDVLVVDGLVAPELVEEAPDDALVVKRAGMTQDAIDRLLVAYGAAGLDVVRLKGGDPFVFGRGGEEALALAEAGVPFEIVPGVSSIASVPGAALIPVTHRGVADRVTIASGHGADGGEPDYDALAPPAGRSCSSWGSSASLGSAQGSSPPASRDDAGSRRLARDAAGSGVGDRNAGDLAELAEGLESPALVVVGDVVSVGALARAYARRL